MHLEGRLAVSRDFWDPRCQSKVRERAEREKTEQNGCLIADEELIKAGRESLRGGYWMREGAGLRTMQSAR